MKIKSNIESALTCPKCGPTVKLVTWSTKWTNKVYLVCPNRPECRYIQPIPEAWIMEAMGQPKMEI
jgi:ssDNA-binding Zn-finger/Zn-ribbon topoisomerase 1